MSCSICGTIPASATANTGRDEYFQAPITSLRRLEIDRDDDLWECPECGAMFLWHDDRSFTGSGNNDEEVLTRFSPEETVMLRAFVHRGDRAAEEVASMADRWLALPGAAPSLVARRVLKQDGELSRALVLRLLDAMERGAHPKLRRSFVEDYASDHDAAFVKSELERRPPVAALEQTRALCRRLLCSICREIPFYPSFQALPPGITPHGASPALDAAECPECGSMFLREGDQWSRLLDYAADALRACLHRKGAVSEQAQEMVIASDRRRSLKIVLAHGLKHDRELIRQFVPRLIREMVLNNPPWLNDLLSDFAGAPGDAVAVLVAIEQSPRRSPELDSLAARCRAVLDAGRASAKSLGLSLLRDGRWAEAARVLGGSDVTRAEDFHNLAVARTRAGDAKGGLEAARKAVALHQALQGDLHPDTLESRLVAALALLETGDEAGAADETRRAAAVIRSQAGEAHPFFADALLIEARRVARQGDGGAAEALARRALFIVRSAGVDGPALRHRESDAAAIGKLWRTAPKAPDSYNVVLWRMSMDHTLRRYRVETLDFVPSGDRPKEWYFIVPWSWKVDQATYAARVVFADQSRALNEREPADANFLDATQARATLTNPRTLTEADLAGLFRQRTWEPTVAFSLVRGGSSVPLSPHALSRALAALGCPDAPLLALGVDAAGLAQARAYPSETLTQELGF